MLQQYRPELNVKELPKMKEVDIDKEPVKFVRLADVVKREIFFELFSLTLVDGDFYDSESKMDYSQKSGQQIRKQNLLGQASHACRGLGRQPQKDPSLFV